MASFCAGAVVAEPFVHTMRVRYAECDAQGVVFNAHYLAYVDDTITAMWRAAFGGYDVMLGRGVDIVVAEANLRFRGSARFDEVVAIEATVVHLGTTSLGTAYRFLRGDDRGHQRDSSDHRGDVGDHPAGELLVEAQLRHVFVTAGTAEKTPIPGWAREGLEAWAAPLPG